MITREQIEVFRRVYTRKLATSTGVDREVVEAMLSMMDLALVGLAAEAADKARERDAELGAAVRGVLGVLDADRCDRIATDAYEGRTFDADRKGFAQLMRTIATHLRTEET